jgi:hypothetical protein
MRRGNETIIGRTLFCLALLGLAPAMDAAAQANSRMRVRLTAPISSDGTAGSKIAAQVVSPADVAGSILEGRITKAAGKGGLRPSSELGFNFETLYYKGKAYPIQGQVIGYYNSKGLQNTDDEGHIIRTSDKPIATAAVTTGIGAAIGALLSGNAKSDNKNARTDTRNSKSSQSNKNSRLNGALAGAAVGAAAGMALGLTADAPNIKFDTGSQFELDVKTAVPERLP